ncbi:MAG: hypothetical protein GXO55_05205 [Chloroflexi bacterium]|nr:hypothetical protein [Chloroflexota bacterium]
MQSILRERLFLFGLVVGLIVGLLIGWVIWPVHYTNAYPADLRHSDKVDYILLISREFQRTGDWEALQRRLSTFPKDTLPDLFVEARKKYAGQTEYTDALDTTWKFIQEHGNLSTKTETGPQTQPSAPGQPETKKQGGHKWLYILGLLLALAVIGLALYRLYQWMNMEKDSYPQPMSRNLETESYPPPEPAPWHSPVSSPVEEEALVVEEEEEEDEEPPFEVEERGEPVSVAPEHRPETIPTDGKPPAVDTSFQPPEAPSLRLVETFYPVFMLEAQQEQAFDVAYTIYETLPDGSEENLGECGLSEAESYQGQVGRPTVMEVWLFDKHDPVSPVQAFILSPRAYAQADIRQKYEAKGKVIQAKPSATIRLRTYALYLEAEIKDVAFAQLGQEDEVFNKLALEMKVYRQISPQKRG